MSIKPGKNKSISDFLFFFGFVTLSVVVFISIVTLNNECIFLRNEIYHLENIRATHLNRVKVLSGNIKNLSRQDRIEEIAFNNFQLHSPSPESLIVYIGDVE
jgi:cell division protein FtsL